MTMIIREAKVEDAQAIMALHERSVLGLCQGDYTLEQLQDWVGRGTLEKYQYRLENHQTWVAELDGKTVGYVRWNPATNELCSIFIDPDYARRGIATKLMVIACEDAAAQGVGEMWLDASLNAVPFYKTLGWQFVENRVHGSLACVRMMRHLV